MSALVYPSSKKYDNRMDDQALLSPPLTPIDCTDTSCPWRQANASLISYQHGSAEHDSYRAAAPTNRMAHDQQHDHPLSAAGIKTTQSDRTKRNKSFIHSYRRYHPTIKSKHTTMPQAVETGTRRPAKRCIRKTTKAHRSLTPTTDRLHIFALDVYESILREPNNLVQSVQPPHPAADNNVEDSSTASSISRKEKTQLAGAVASYDAIDIENDDSTVFSDDWVPKSEALDHKHVKIVWKGKNAGLE
jgi:hypothetical protein